MKEAVAFSPAHITGLFQICDSNLDPLLNGSRGAGVSIEKGVTTRVSIEPSPKTSFKITINKRVMKSAEVSEHVIRTFLSQVHGKFRIFVEHEVAVPIGSGFGSSGAGALSLSLALNEVLGLNLPRVETTQIAHIADLECRTGLGTVIAETFGGLEIRIKAGAPGIGEVKQIPVNGDYALACLNFAPISKEGILTDNKIRERINRFGGRLVDELIANPTPQSFMVLSRRFAEHSELISSRLRRVIDEADKGGFICSMAMVGENLFTLVERDSLDRVLKVFHGHAPSKDSVIISGLDFEGPRLL